MVGDLHGDYPSLLGLLKICNPAKDCLIFLGDYADRGSYGVEVIETVSDLAIEYPKNVFLLKGNHEDYTNRGKPTFSQTLLNITLDYNILADTIIIKTKSIVLFEGTCSFGCVYI